MTEAIASRVARVFDRVAEVAHRAGRGPEEVRVVGAAKAKSAQEVVAACRAGLAEVGENFAQEAREKIPCVNDTLTGEGRSPPRWHFIGQLQRNKVRLVVPLVDCVQSVDRLALAQELDRRAEKRARRLEVLLQVNLHGEPQKGGVAPERLDALLEGCLPLARLSVIGLMTVPPLTADPEASRESFRSLRKLLEVHQGSAGGRELRHLSMGMSHDFEVAIEEGATLVRIGTALFGPRGRPE